MPNPSSSDPAKAAAETTATPARVDPGAETTAPVAASPSSCADPAAETAALDSDAPHARGDDDVLPRRIGDYLVERELARGGMGIVLLARHAQLARQVALKVLRAGKGASPAAIERFQIEARAAARLRHPAIVGIHEVGRDGQRWFLAMDYVPGRTLQERIEAEGPLAPREAARVLERLARALHYAHTQAVLHRDLKPHNVLLDSDGQPFLTDFGLAKEIDRGQGLTATGEVLGTPAYMSPEQASGEPARVDRRADIYGLGATLYALLTGRAPHEGETVLDILRQVTSKAPRPPRRLRPGLDPAIETICLRCLEFEPERRYPTAADLAEDLERYLRDEAIVARPPSLLGRLRSWRGRNRALARAVAGIGGAACLVLLAGGLWFVERLREQRDAATSASREAERRRVEAEAAGEAARRARAEAQRQAERAVLQLGIAREALDLMVRRVGNELIELPGARARALRQELLGEALDHYQRLCAAQVRDLVISHTAADALLQLGMLQRTLGRTEDARATLEQALESARALEAEDGPGALRLGMTLVALAQLHLERGEPSAAVSLVEEAVARARTLRARDERKAHRDALAEALMVLASLRREQGDTGAAREAQTEVLELHRALAREHPENPKALQALNRSLLASGDLLCEEGDLAGAVPSYEEGRRVARELMALDPPGSYPRPELSAALDKLARVRRLQGDLPEALRMYREVVRVSRELLEEDPTSRYRRRALALALGQVGEVLGDQGQLEPALAARDESLAILEELSRRDPGSADARHDLATGHYLAGRLRQRAQQLDAALTHFRATHAAGQALLELDPSGMRAHANLSAALDGIAHVHQLRGQLPEACTALEAALEHDRRLAADPRSATARHNLAGTLISLADLRAELGRLDAALAGSQEGVAIRRELLARDPSSAFAQRGLVVSLERAGDIRQKARRWEDALACYQEALALARGLLAQTPTSFAAQRGVANMLERVAETQGELQHLPEALAAYEALRAFGAELHALDARDVNALQDLALAHSGRAQVLQTQGKPDDARVAWQEAVVFARRRHAREPQGLAARHELALTLEALAQGFRDEPAGPSLEAVREAVALRRSLVASLPGSPLAQRDLSETLIACAAIHDARGERDAARGCLREALQLRRQAALQLPNLRREVTKIEALLEAFERGD